MRATLRHWLTPPSLLDDPHGEEQRIRRTLTVLLWGALFTLGSLIIINFMQENLMAAGVLLGMNVILTILFVVMRRGQLLLASWLVPLIVLLGVTYIFFNDQGVWTVAIIAYPLVIIVASLLLGQRATLVFTLLAFVAMAFLMVAEMEGWILVEVGALSYLSVVTLVPLLGITAVMLYTIMENFSRSLEQAKQNETAAHRANTELIKIKASLEETIAQRTAALETALREVEDAQQSLEQQAWLANGQASLGERMYGLQDQAELAVEVIRHLCQYSDAQLGALFLFTDNRLKMMGCYAHLRRPHMVTEFQLGEGLVGQAALERKRLVLSNIPDAYWAVTDGLFTAVPHHVVALPFLHHNDLIGVVEIAYLHPISDTKLEFLESVMPNIATAFTVIPARRIPSGHA